MALFKKINPRRTKVRKSITTERFARIRRFVNTQVITGALLWLLFVAMCVIILSFELIKESSIPEIASLSMVVILISFAGALYVYYYQKRIIGNLIRTLTLIGLFILMLAVAKFGILLLDQPAWATGTAVTTAIILTIAYDQRFAIGMSTVYCVLCCFAATATTDMRLFLTMSAGAAVCCFSLREIRTRMKLIEVSAVAASIVLLMSASLGFLANELSASYIFKRAGFHALATFLVGLLIQSLLPLIEKVFRIATSMTLLDHSDANQPLLKRLAMEAPGTFSHSLLVGSVAEAAAEAIGRNGLLCRVGAYYHDIGKINKPTYFTENAMGTIDRHKELSPAMSQLVIIGHVKDGVEMAKEYGLPAVLRQFIETHHGTTLIEYFFNEAKKKRGEKDAEPSESEFRYAGPKPRTKEAAIVMLADTVEGAVRSLGEITPSKIEAVVRNMALKRLQDGQFDECDMSLRELSKIEASITKTLAAHYHGRIAYPKRPDIPEDEQADPQEENAEAKNQ